MSPNTIVQPSERVPVVSNYYDGPLNGVAYYQGKPYSFVMVQEIFLPCSPDQIDKWGELSASNLVYNLYSIDQEMLDKVLEQHEIFERWHEAYSAGKVQLSKASNTRLPEDEARYQELKSITEAWEKSLSGANPDHVFIGDFSCSNEGIPPGRSRWQSFHVVWRPVPAGLNIR